MAIIDFHSHILPGIDDGSKNSEMSIQMLHTAAGQGITTIVATPHFYADSMTIDTFLRNRSKACQRLCEKEIPKQIQILCGAEVSFFTGIGQTAEIARLKIEGTDLLMIEMPFRQWSGRELYEIEWLLRNHTIPIIAHLERYIAFQKDKSILSALLELPVYIQINAECLQEWKTRRWAIRMFKQGQAHLLGSDCHNNTSRPENLFEGRNVLQRKLGAACLEEIDELGAYLLGVR